MIFEFELRTESEANRRGSWRGHDNRRKRQRQVTAFFCRPLKGAFEPTQDLEVTFTRIAPSNGLDDDNLRSAFKAIRDEVARLLERDDREGQGVDWRYEQERGAPKHYAVRVEVRAVTLEDRIAEARRHLAELEARREA